jgi:hypothetical protein
MLLWVVDEAFYEKVREAKKMMREYLKNKNKEPPVVFYQGKVVIHFD